MCSTKKPKLKSQMYIESNLYFSCNGIYINNNTFVIIVENRKKIIENQLYIIKKNNKMFIILQDFKIKKHIEN